MISKGLKFIFVGSNVFDDINDNDDDVDVDDAFDDDDDGDVHVNDYDDGK